MKMLFNILTVFSSIYLAYWVITGLAVFIKRKPASRLNDRIHHFAIVICARNEENVIGELIDSLHEQEYPMEKTEIFVICDNCTDHTENIALQKGANVLVREDSEKKTKGYALDYFFRNRINQIKEFDAACFFDADNIIDYRFLSVMNEHLQRGEKIIQGFRDSKNPNDSWTTTCHSILFWNLTMLRSKAHANLSLSAMVGGTGFVVSSDLIDEPGWSCRTICEDSEFSLKNILSGRKVTVATDAIFYDEQPSKLSQSLRQRFRWSTGGLQNMKLYLPKMAKNFIKKPHIQWFDSMMHLLTYPMICITFMMQLIAMGMLIHKLIGVNEWQGIFMLMMPIFMGYMSQVLQAGLAVLLVGKSLGKMAIGILLYPVFSLFGSIVALAAIFCKKPEWRPIVHHSSRAVDLENKKVSASRSISTP